MALFSCFPAADSGNARNAVLAYRMAVDGIEPEHVAMAVQRFIQGRVDRHRHAFMPSAPELAIEARRLKDEAGAARAKPLALAKPDEEKPVDPEMRKRVMKMFEDLARKMQPKPKVAAGWLELKDDDLSACADWGDVRPSAELASKLGVKQEGKA